MWQANVSFMVATASICVSGVGMVASLGQDAVTGCAAARAGLVRARPLDYPVWSPVNGEIGPVCGHAIPELTAGFEGEARHLRIIHGAMSDLARNCRGAPWEAPNTGLYLSLPDPWREMRGAELIGDKKLRQKRLDAAAGIPEGEAYRADAERLIAKACRLCGTQRVPELRAVSRSGQCGLAECLLVAMQDLRQNRVDRAVVGACDSLLEEKTLEWLEMTQRLKSPTFPAGLAPREAGVFFLF